MKRLYLVRHAKSSWDDQSLQDIDRPLNARGSKNAPDMGQRLKQRGSRIDLLISSPANRARTTARYIAEALDYPEEDIEINDQIYFEGASSIIDIIQQTSAPVDNLMLVGHNPDMTSVFNFLAGYQTMNLPTCAVATLTYDGEWQSMDRESANVLHYDTPKN